MKVAVLIYGDINKKSGGYLYDRKLVDQLQKEGIDVEIISIPEKNYFQNIEDNFNPQLLKRLQTLDADILLEDELNHPSLFHLNDKLKDSHVEYSIISIVHHLSYQSTRNEAMRNAKKFFEKKYLSTIDGFIFNSRTSKRDVQTLFEEAEGVVATPGKDHIHPEKKENKSGGEELQVLFVGNIVAHKGVESLIYAIEKTDEFSLKIVGNKDIDEKYTEKIEKIIEQKNLESRIEFTGFVSRDELSSIFMKSDIFALPSYYEGYGIVYVEALGFGLPVLATRRGGAEEIVTHNQEGFLISPGRSREIVKYLTRLKDYQLLEKMSKNARRRYEELPEWRESMKKIIDYLKSIS